MEHKFFVGTTEFTVQLVQSDYEGPLNRVYGFVFHIIEGESKPPKAIRIALSDNVIDMWQGFGGNSKILEDKDVFAWQLVPHFLPQLLTKDVVSIFIHTSDTIEKKEGTTYIKADTTISGTARAIIFSSERPTNNLIRREILKVCFNSWQLEPHGYVSREELVKFIPASLVELERNLDYLVKTYYIDGTLTTGGYLMVRITPQGINVFEDPTQFERVFALTPEQQTLNVGGNLITTIIVGEGNTNMINSGKHGSVDNKK